MIFWLWASQMGLAVFCLYQIRVNRYLTSVIVKQEERMDRHFEMLKMLAMAEGHLPFEPETIRDP